MCTRGACCLLIMAKDLACVEGSRRNTGKEVVITERKGHRTDKKRNLKITTERSAWWNQLGIHFPLRRSGRTLDKQRGDKDHQRLSRALVYSCMHISHSGLEWTNCLSLKKKGHRTLNTHLLFLPSSKTWKAGGSRWAFTLGCYPRRVFQQAKNFAPWSFSLTCPTARAVPLNFLNCSRPSVEWNLYPPCGSFTFREVGTRMS